MPRMLRSCRLAVALSALVVPAVQAHDLAFEERVEAQAALERVYYAHQVGTTKPFEEAVPRVVLEAKVEKYLKQSVALERFWNAPLTAETLQAEMERQARQSRMPERLRELYAALGDDPYLVRECLARPALVDRLTRNFFAFDGRLHAAANEEAETLRRDLVRYGVEAFTLDPRRSEVEIVQVEEHGAAVRQEREAEAGRMELSPERYSRWRTQAPRQVGEIGPLREEREAFVIQVVLEEHPASARIASFTVAKRSWESWWEGTAQALDAGSVGAAGGDGALPVVESAAPRPTSSCPPDDTWDNGTLDGARSGHTAVWTGSQMIVWGGVSGFFRLNTGVRYEPATDTWTSTSIVGAPAARNQHTAVWTGSMMIVWGGQSGGPGSGMNSGGRYDPVTDSWTPTSTVGAPSSRSDHTAVWTGGQMVVWGGYGLNTGGRYDPATDSWAPTSTVGAPSGRSDHTTVWTGGLMVVWGGFGGGYLNTGGRYDPVADFWASTSTVGAPSARERHTAVWTGNRMIVWGGYGGGYWNTGSRYDPLSDSWTPISTVDAPSARIWHTAVWTGSLMVVWAGSGGSLPFKTGGRYDPATDSWTPTSTASAPAGRSGHSAVWTGSLMVVWGGDNFVTPAPLDTGGRYDPTTNGWTATYPVSGPDAYIDHTAVWTGSLMIVWGFSELSPLNTGGRYNPAIDSWTPTSTTGAPSARMDHTAVWAGNSMLVWGGEYWTGEGTVPLNTGSRYDPAADSWAAISTVGAPAARHDHTAVWTGNSMLVWGGESSGRSYLNTGGRYDPAGDTWMPMSIVAAPAARELHTAVWTGNRMVVWGGNDGSALRTGGRYDPVTDTWAPTSTSGGPSPRYDHTAVWTGSLMVVWGGSPGSDIVQLNTGGRYDPVIDSWAATSTVGVPSVRQNHTAVWTGNTMVVWGGKYWQGVVIDGLATGGRYDPATDGWAPTSSMFAPSARYYHSAVWTGYRMIVWGGYDGGQLLNSGGRYSLGQSSDADGDGLACAADCDDADAGVFAIPSEVTGLHFAADGETLNWDSAAAGAGSATVHDVLSGVFVELPVGNGAGEACLDSTAATSIVVSDVPSSGSGYWYLVRGRNLCGDGTYGSASDGTPRASTACP